MVATFIVADIHVERTFLRTFLPPASRFPDVANDRAATLRSTLRAITRDLE